MPAIFLVQVPNVVHAPQYPMVQPIVQVVNAAIHANPDIRIMARFVARMLPMAPLHMTAARLVASPATAVIMNPAVLVYRINVQMARNNAPEGFRRRVPVAYGRAVQRVMQIRFAVVGAVRRAHQVSMYMAIPVKTTVHQIADRMEMHVPKIMQRQHARVAHVFIHAKPISVM